jgi:esterase/lipase superfamily enzyme
MEEDFTVHSTTMDRDFDVEVYGTGGAPIIVLPEGNGSCSSWNDNGMVETLSDHIDNGTIQLFCVDSADASGWYFREGVARYRKKAALSYMKFLCQEFVPFVRSKNQGPAHPCRCWHRCPQCDDCNASAPRALWRPSCHVWQL